MAYRQLQLPLEDYDLSTTLPIDNNFDVDLANALAEKESFNKHLYRPNTYLHKWWARRCGSTFRLILKHLVLDDANRGYYSAGGLEGMTILDPMMGGATTLHEAIRLGANVIGFDIDPIPVLQARATLADTSLAELTAAFREFSRDLTAQLEGFYKTACPSCGTEDQSQFTLYGLVKDCDCGPSLFVDSLVLRHNTDGTTIRLCPKCLSVGTGGCSCSSDQPVIAVREKDTKACITCGRTYRERTTLPFYQRYRPIAVVGRCKTHGLFFKKPQESDLSLLAMSDQQRVNFASEAEDFVVHGGPKSGDLVRRGISNYLDLFTSRQLAYLSAAIKALRRYPEHIRLMFGLLVSTSTEFNSLLCGYKGGDKKRPGAIRHVFSHHAYSFPHTALENNPLFPGRASGTLVGLFEDRIRRGRVWAVKPVERVVTEPSPRTVTVVGEVDCGCEVTGFGDLGRGNRRFMVVQGSSTNLGIPADSVDHVVTDPPYFDSVQYSDLAAFFRVWLKKLLPDAADWEYDLSRSAVDFEASGNGHYAKTLAGIFGECHRVLKKDTGRLVFTYHHWNPKAWASLTLALMRAQFVLINRYVVHSENPVSVHISNLNALTDDAVLVLAPSETRGKRTAWTRPQELRKESSASFCSDCATLLGWMLDSELSEEQVQQCWKSLLP